MRIIKQLADDIKCNIEEAKDKIGTAYMLRDTDLQAAMWYKDMAVAHLGFNDKGHAVVAKLISDYRNSDEYKANPGFADGMKAVWDAEHVDLVRKSAEVQAMIGAFK